MGSHTRSEFQELYRRIERRSHRHTVAPAYFGTAIVLGIALMFAVIAALDLALRAAGHR